jgi:hypothetical protein
MGGAPVNPARVHDLGSRIWRRTAASSDGDSDGEVVWGGGAAWEARQPQQLPVPPPPLCGRGGGVAASNSGDGAPSSWHEAAAHSSFGDRVVEYRCNGHAHERRRRRNMWQILRRLDGGDDTLVAA